MAQRRPYDGPRDDEELLPPDTEVTSTLYRGPRAKKRKAIIGSIVKSLRSRPFILALVALVLYMVISWLGYMYHVFHHRYFGAFSPHEKMLCRDEKMMLHVQQVMWARAKGEIANIIPDEQKNEFYGISRKCWIVTLRQQRRRRLQGRNRVDLKALTLIPLPRL